LRSHWGKPEFPYPLDRDGFRSNLTCGAGAAVLVRLWERLSLPLVAPLPRLELRCFGPPTARVNGKAPPAAVLWRKHLALLIYLALSPNRVRTRDHLRGLLWPENDEERARRSLNEAIRRLRRALGDDRLGSDGDSVAMAGEGLIVEQSGDAGFLEGFSVSGWQSVEEWVTAECSQRRA